MSSMKYDRNAPKYKGKLDDVDFNKITLYKYP